MSIEERKAMLVSLILTSDEEELISLLEEDVTEYKLLKQRDAVDDLSAEERDELRIIMEEPADKDTVTFKEFKAEMASWRAHS